MDISTYFSDIFTDANQNYPDLIEIDQFSRKPSYVGCGCTSNYSHIYVVLICTLPLFKKLEDAQSSLLEMFG